MLCPRPAHPNGPRAPHQVKNQHLNHQHPSHTNSKNSTTIRATTCKPPRSQPVGQGQTLGGLFPPGFLFSSRSCMCASEAACACASPSNRLPDSASKGQKRSQAFFGGDNPVVQADEKAFFKYQEETKISARQQLTNKAASNRTGPAKPTDESSTK